MPFIFSLIDLLELIIELGIQLKSQISKIY